MATYINREPSTLRSNVVETRFNQKYIGSIGTIVSLGSYLNTPGTPLDFGNLFVTPEEYIVSVRAYPFQVTKLSKVLPSTTHIWLGVEDTGIDAKTLNAPYPSLRLGTYIFREKYHSYLDYAPYTKITVWLPYVGFVELDPNEVMGKRVAFDYQFDLDSGEVTACISYITYTENVNALIKTASAKIGIDIPLGSTNAREIQKNLFTTATSIVGTSLIMPYTKGFGTAMVGLSATKQTKDVFNAFQVHYNKGNASIQGVNNLSQPQSIYIIFERNELVYSPIQTKGKPYMQMTKLGALHGYTEVERFTDSMDLGTATSDEVNLIKNYLQTGVYLP